MLPNFVGMTYGQVQAEGATVSPKVWFVGDTGFIQCVSEGSDSTGTPTSGSLVEEQNPPAGTVLTSAGTRGQMVELDVTGCYQPS